MIGRRKAEPEPVSWVLLSDVAAAGVERLGWNGAPEAAAGNLTGVVATVEGLDLAVDHDFAGRPRVREEDAGRVWQAITETAAAERRQRDAAAAEQAEYQDRERSRIELSTRDLLKFPGLALRVAQNPELMPVILATEGPNDPEPTLATIRSASIAAQAGLLVPSDS